MRRSFHKFHAKPTTVDGIRFASQREAKRYAELRLLEHVGRIRGLTLQPVYPLHVVNRAGMYEHFDFPTDDLREIAAMIRQQGQEDR